jgi:hypothetical protein
VARLAVADQLPVAVLAEDPEASAGTVRARKAQIVEATDVGLTTNPPFACLIETRIAWSPVARPYKTLKP